MTAYFLQFTNSDISLRLLAACHSKLKTPDINEIRGYLEQEECDVNIREDDEVKDDAYCNVISKTALLIVLGQLLKLKCYIHTA